MLRSKTVEAILTMAYTYPLHRSPPRMCGQCKTQVAPSPFILAFTEISLREPSFFLRFMEVSDNLVQGATSILKVASMWRSFTLLRHGANGFALIT